jgi:hypothetical protein
MAFDGWVWGIDAATFGRLIECTDGDPPRLFLANQAEILPIQQAWLDRLARGGDGPISFAALPLVQLVVDCPDFAPDYFVWGGLSFVSAALREALALAPGVVEYLPVDASRSRPEVIARDYRVMSPLFVRSLIDLKHTAHERVPVQRADGSIGEEVLLTPERRQYWRTDFEADVPLFRAAHSGAIVADDAVAGRVLAAGATGVAFQDVTSDRAQSELVLKALETSA